MARHVAIMKPSYMFFKQAATLNRQIFGANSGPRLHCENYVASMKQRRSANNYFKIRSFGFTRSLSSFAVRANAVILNRRLAISNGLSRPTPATLVQEIYSPTNFEIGGSLTMRMQSMTSVLAVSDQDYGALVGKGLVARKRGDRAATLDWFKKAAASNRSAPTAWIEIATELRNSGEFDEARRTLKEGLVHSPDDYACLLNLGYIERAAGNWAEASTIFERVIKLYPRYAQPYIDRAAEEFRLGRPQVATELLEFALTIAIDHPGVLDALAQHARSANNLEKALELNQRNYSANPAHVWAHLNAAKILAALGKTDEAFSLLDSLEARLGSQPDLFIVRAEILKQTGFYAKAKALLAKGHASFPREFRLWMDHTLIQIEMGEFDAAEQALRGPPTSNASEIGRVHYVRGMMAMARWNFPEAKSEFEQAARNNLHDGGLLEKAALAAILSLDLEGAERNLRGYANLNISMNALRRRSANFSQTHYGYHLNEFRLDQGALERVIAARQQTTPEHRLDSLRSTVRDYPDYTPAAMLLLIEMRRQGIFPTLAAVMSAGGNSLIPKTIVQFWDTEDLPDDLERLAATWQQQNPDYVYTRFSDRRAAMYVEANYGSDVVSAYRRANEPAMKADLFRLAYLFRNGGFMVMQMIDAWHRSLHLIQAAIL